MSFDSSMRANAWKWLALLAIAIFSICVTVPKDSIRLGLDLRGGTSFTLGVDEEGFYQPNYISRKAELSGKDLVSAHVDRDEVGRVVVAFKLNNNGGLATPIFGLRRAA